MGGVFGAALTAEFEPEEQLEDCDVPWQVRTLCCFEVARHVCTRCTLREK